jgi:hypothetical protein
VIAVFAGHLLTALITTEIFAEELFYVFHATSTSQRLYREYALSVIFAFALGYFVYYKWHSAPGKWIWIVAVVLFADRALSAWHARYSVVTGEPSLGTVCREMFGPVYQPNSTVYALILERTTLYSIGAWACWSGEKYGWSAVSHYVKACLTRCAAGAQPRRDKKKV